MRVSAGTAKRGYLISWDESSERSAKAAKFNGASMARAGSLPPAISPGASGATFRTYAPPFHPRPDLRPADVLRHVRRCA